MGLNRGTYEPEKAIDVNPVMGVHNVKANKLLDILMEWEPCKYIRPIVTSPLGYLMPEIIIGFGVFSTALILCLI